MLGRPLPHARALPTGVRLGRLSIDGAPPFGVARMVHITYAAGDRNVATLDVFRQPTNAIPAGNLGEVNATVAGSPAIVQQSRPGSLPFDDVHYLWVRDNVLFSLHVGLTAGITREAADAMANSFE